LTVGQFEAIFSRAKTLDPIVSKIGKLIVEKRTINNPVFYVWLSSLRSKGSGPRRAMRLMRTLAHKGKTGATKTYA
jgi:hypothetical protein